MVNRLAGQISPYLLQHQNNPVDWHPWGPEALAMAAQTNRPILLSIGYAACHWCHVMAHESFENPAIAALMNDHFVNIKVDREERPDLDAIYQQALALTGQGGGWPLTMFLTPAGEPFWGGTYFPPQSRYGRPGFSDVLLSIHRAWSTQPTHIRQTVAAFKRGLADITERSATSQLPDPDKTAEHLLGSVDLITGGMRGAPKFPQPGLFEYLWRAYLRAGDSRFRTAVTVTLDNICRGGIYDHIGGGFMRYSTDEEWLVPHFEKMLYDNAQLIELLCLVWQTTKDPLYQHRVTETVQWILREMTAEDGAFASSLDADSEGEEGRFYTWSSAEIEGLLEPKILTDFKAAYDVDANGNWDGRSILHQNHPGHKIESSDRYAEPRSILLHHRSTRTRPGRDDKILADWNGMMIAALAKASTAFSQPLWLAAALRAYETVRCGMTLPENRLAHAMRDGRTGAVGLVDDLAHMARAAIILAEVTGTEEYLRHAQLWIAAADRFHWDAAAGGYFQAVVAADDLIVRLKPYLDMAIPSANGVLAQALVRLWQMTGADHYRQRAESTVVAFLSLGVGAAPAMTSLLAAAGHLAHPLQIIVIGPPDRHDTIALLSVTWGCPYPDRVVLQYASNPNEPDHHPAAGKVMIDGKATAYVCRDCSCSGPFTDATQLRDALMTHRRS